MNKLFGLNSKCKNNNNVPKVKVEKENKLRRVFLVYLVGWLFSFLTRD